MSIRTEQLASTLRKAVQQVITRGLNDPRVRGLVSVTKVQISPDLAEAYIDVSIFPREHTTLTMHGLKSSAGHIRSDVSKFAQLRRTPKLVFRLDESLKKQADVLAAIDDHQDDVDETADDAPPTRTFFEFEDE